MRHNREEVIRRTNMEFEQLNALVSNLMADQWAMRVPRPETKDPWTVKDTLAHITYWKADAARSARGLPRPAELRGLNETGANHLIYMRWRDRSPRQVLTWHQQVQDDVVVALRTATDEWFSGRERKKEWPYDLEGHSAYHRVKDIEQALKTPLRS